MSCNGCRVLRKGCGENCILRQSLQRIDTPKAQANATVFVAKFFGRAGLMSFLAGVTESQRPGLFQSLLFEACGRTVNPVNGAVGLLWTGNWRVCQLAVETVLRGGVLNEMPEFTPATVPDNQLFKAQDLKKASKRKALEDIARLEMNNHLDLGLPSLDSEESDTTTLESGLASHPRLQAKGETKLLRLFF